MKKNILGTICVFILAINACSAQTNGPQIGRIWGEAIDGVQLSISIKESVLTNNSQVTISAEIRNLSTNVVQLSGAMPEQAFVVKLANDSGKTYQLTHNAIVITRPLSFQSLKLKPGQDQDCIIHVMLDENIDLGNYHLKATRYASIDSSVFKIQSNLLNVQIK